MRLTWVLTFGGCLSLILLHLSGLALAQLEGVTKGCENEGQEIPLPANFGQPCIKCFCKDRRVECGRVTCPSLEGCHLIPFYPQTTPTCCTRCKGCVFYGKKYLSGDEWSTDKDQCIQHTCQAGVVTSYKQTCYAPCASPERVAGQCCPICSSCYLRDRKYLDGATFNPTYDPCTQCTCEKGNIHCIKKTCPVLNCRPEFIHKPEDSCCPICKSNLTLVIPPSSCIFRSGIKKEGTPFKLDACTTCSCKSGTTVCERLSCPVADCPLSEQKRRDGECCPYCAATYRHCSYQGRLRRHGQVWARDICTRCFCKDGRVYCKLKQCQNRVVCPKHEKLKVVPGHCCPRCVPEEAVCTVFGDPHYRTFDGLPFNFQGRCKYQLAGDCMNGTFTLRARNDGQRSRDFSWTNHVVLNLKSVGYTISLKQNLAVRVNKRRAKLPHVQIGVFSIVKEGQSVVVTTAAGIRLVWDGRSYLEVWAAPKLRGQLCGLCGNFNGIVADDFRGKRGEMFFDGENLGNSWRVGSRKACRGNRPKTSRRRKKQRTNTCSKDVNKRMRALRHCDVFRSPVFTACRAKVKEEPYYKSCLLDMCECSETSHCGCQSYLAYSRACSRAGADVDMSPFLNCQEFRCTGGAVYTTCGSACVKTCASFNKSDVACDKPCVAGCRCPDGLVRHRDRCINPVDCPS